MDFLLQCRFVGPTATPEVLQKLTYLVIRHPKVKRIDTVRAYTFGVLYFVEVSGNGTAFHCSSTDFAYNHNSDSVLLHSWGEMDISISTQKVGTHHQNPAAGLHEYQMGQLPTLK